jgi:hypothetical protein
MPEASRPIKTTTQPQPTYPMKTTLAILTAIIGFSSFAQAGPNRPGFIFQTATDAKKVVRSAQPTGPQCTMKRIEVVDFGGRRGGPGYAVSKTVNCTGQKCCATMAAMTKAGCSTMG